MIVPKSVINKIHRVEFSLYEPASTTVLWAYPVGQSYDYRLFLAGQWTSVSDNDDASLLELIQRAELAIKAAVAATEGAEAVNAALTGNVITITDREGNTTSLDLSEIGGGYEPPVGGIPKTDLASDVQTSLGKADTALQSFTETDPTVPSWAKQSTKPSYSYNEISGTPNLATVATSGSYNDLSDKPIIPDISEKQNVIDSTHKLSADLVEDGTTNKSYTATEKTKLAGIASGAEVNVQANWNETNTSSDAFIQNKPTDLAHIGDTQGSATIANFDPQTDTVHIAAQVLSTAAQAQVRQNIGAGTSNFSGSYNDLTNKPTIPTVPSNIVVGSTKSYTIAVVSSMPSTPDANTIYLVTGS